MIDVVDLHKGFEGKDVLNGIDLDVQDREVMVILGPSGQGKTVLIKTMVGLLEPDSGVINYDGQNISGIAGQALRAFQHQIAFVFQTGALFEFLDVRENLALFPRMNQKLSNRQIQDMASKMLSLVGLDESVLPKFPEELSGGMKKRVAIARAMMKNPRYLFYDEPTAGLDRGNSEMVAELIRELKSKTAVTSVIVTHDVQLMRQVADRVALLKLGRILFTGRPDEISSETLERLYDIRENNGL
jgi:phospholipid/cholesterol/gamma-HCH transport system ATP-binding protein